MRLPIACWTCKNDEADQIILREYNDIGRYDYTCRFGHKNTMFLLNPKFELLLLWGCMQLKMVITVRL